MFILPGTKTGQEEREERDGEVRVVDWRRRESGARGWIRGEDDWKVEYEAEGG